MTGPLTDPTYAEQLEREVLRQRLREDARRVLRSEQRSTTPPAPVGLEDFLAEPPRRTTWWVKDLLPSGGRVLLAAAWKAGKTSLASNLIRSLADGDPFLDAHDTQQVPGRVVLLDDELDRDMLRTWLSDQHIVHPERVSVFSLRGKVASLDLLDPEALTLWAERLAALAPDVIVLDCLRPVLDALGLDENHDVGRFLVAFDALVDRCGAQAAVVVHHMGHSGERARGDSRLRDWPDVEWRLIRANPEDPTSQRYFTAYGRDVDQPERQLGYNPHTRRLAVTGGSRRGGDAGADLTRLVLAWVAEHPGQSGRAVVTGVAGAHKTPQRAVRTALSAAAESGRILTQQGPNRSLLHFATEPPEETP